MTEILMIATAELETDQQLKLVGYDREVQTHLLILVKNEQ